jgi:hypothetical protein
MCEDLTHLESLDESERQAAPGARGRLVVTDLAGWLMLFIRYDQGNLATYHEAEAVGRSRLRRNTQIRAVSATSSSSKTRARVPTSMSQTRKEDTTGLCNTKLSSIRIVGSTSWWLQTRTTRMPIVTGFWTSLAASFLRTSALRLSR